MELLKIIELECGQTYLTKLEDGNILEMGDVFMSVEKGLGTRPYKFKDFDMPSDTGKRVMTICTMAGCNCSCQFCASRNSFKRNLTADEMVNQIEFMIEEGIRRGRNDSPNNAEEFRVLYTRMGEPMLNVKNVVDSIRMLKGKYPKLIVGMSTSGYKKGLDYLLENKDVLKYMDLQLSTHSTSNKERGTLFNKGNNIMSIEELLGYAHKIYEVTGNKVSLNMIIFKGYTYDFKSLLKYINKDEIWIRLSPFNVVSNEFELEGLIKTEDVLDKKPITSDELKVIISNLEESGISYSYAPAIDEEIKNNVACGQALVAFKNESL
jgi:adenine C2-methylase RlmN of 23S rRNA A2503 and tRNA A37